MSEHDYARVTLWGPFKGASGCMLYLGVHQLACSRALLVNGVILSEEIVSHERMVARNVQAIEDDCLTCYAEKNCHEV